jgi:tetratricopeptide (TPR) repeat protein
MISKLIKSFTVFQNSLNMVCVVACTLIFFSCTAYFNTYYNGKIAFEEGQKAHMKMLRHYPDSIIIKPNDDIMRKYDRTIEKSKKVMELYEKDKRWHDDALLLIGKAYYFKRENTPAVRKLTQLQKEFPASPLIPESYFYLAKAYVDMGEFDKAEELCGMILQKYPSFNKGNEVSLLMVDIAIMRGGRSQAIGLLEKARKSVRSEEKRIQILLRICELYVDLKQYDKAIALLEKAPRNKDFPQQSFRMDKALFTCYSELGKYDKALQLIDVMLKKKMYEDFHKDLLYMKAMVFKRLDRLDDAIDTFKKLTAGVDSTEVLNDTSSVVGKAFYELALIYQFKRADYKSAQKYAVLAAQARDTTVKIQASTLRDAFIRLEKLRNEKDSTTQAKMSRLFKIGELFRFELSEPDSAYNEFIFIIKNSPDTFTIIPMALSAAACVAKNNLKKNAVADSLFNLIIKRYPSSDYGKLAQRELNRPVTIMTRQDSAYQAFRTAEGYLYGKDPDIKKAITAYHNVYRLYPEMDIAPKSLFTAAWLIDEVLQKNKTARELYQKVCKKYPTSQYCTAQAKPRLEEVEKAIAEMKKKKQVVVSQAGAVNQRVVKDSADSSNASAGSSAIPIDSLQKEESSSQGGTEIDKESIDSTISDEPDTLTSPPQSPSQSEMEKEKK